MATRPADTLADGVDLSQHVADPDRLASTSVPGGGKTHFVVRYSTPDTTNNPGKQLKAPELGRIRAAGLALVIVSETTAGRASAGYTAGRTDARIASAYCASLGMPADMVIYWAADKDFTGAQIDAYARGWRDEIGVHRCGVYGGIDVVKWCFDHGLVGYGWQTFAWSEGHIDPRANAYQWMNGQSFAGNEVDFDAALTHDYGQWEPGAGAGDRGLDMALTDADVAKIWAWPLNNPVTGQDAAAGDYLRSINKQVNDLDTVRVPAVQSAETAEATALAGLPAAVAAEVAAFVQNADGEVTAAEIEEVVANVFARTSLTVAPPAAGSGS